MDRVLPVARGVAEDLARDGAGAVVLVGSHAREEAGPESDVDLLAVGPRDFSYRLERRGGFLVSASSRPLRAYRAELDDPGSVCTAVPGWREAVPLHDPEGIAASLIKLGCSYLRQAPRSCRGRIVRSEWVRMSGGASTQGGDSEASEWIRRFGWRRR